MLSLLRMVPQKTWTISSNEGEDGGEEERGDGMRWIVFQCI
jgi:hypothetical protein